LNANSQNRYTLKFDSTDIKIIKILQKNARESIANIARTLEISPNAALNRYEKIQKSGIIKKTFNPIILPQYLNGKNQTYRMQLLIKSEIHEIQNIIRYTKSLALEHTEIECVETIGHFNILVWIISEDPIDLHLVKDKLQVKTGIQEIKANILPYSRDLYAHINLDHLEGKEAFG
jgi:Lrp/AsnC family transcriptional regulator, leucine-responsive regulatory protein